MIGCEQIKVIWLLLGWFKFIAAPGWRPALLQCFSPSHAFSPPSHLSVMSVHPVFHHICPSCLSLVSVGHVRPSRPSVMSVRPFCPSHLSVTSVHHICLSRLSITFVHHICLSRLSVTSVCHVCLSRLSVMSVK